MIKNINKKYRVEVVDLETNKVVSIIGRNLDERRAEQRIATGLTRFDPNKVFIRDVEES